MMGVVNEIRSMDKNDGGGGGEIIKTRDSRLNIFISLPSARLQRTYSCVLSRFT